MEHHDRPDVIRNLREKDTFARALGIEILEASNGRARVTMPLGAETANALGMAHGGVIFSLADLALAAAANSGGIVSVSVQADIQYMTSCPSEGRLFASAEKVGETRRLAWFRVTVFTPDDAVIAVCQAMVYRLGPPRE